MSPRQRQILLGDRIRRDVHAAVCVLYPEHKDDTLETALVVTGDGWIIATYKGGVVRKVRIGELEVDDEPFDAPGFLRLAGVGG